MEIIYLSYPHELKRNQHSPTVLALGYFDGVHLGHQKVIKTAVDIAKEKHAESAVMTFTPHPKEVLSRSKEPMKYITPIKQKAEYIKQLGVEKLYIVRFDLAFSKLTPQQFVDEFLLNLHVVHVVAGFDYTYGHLGKGTMETLPFHARGQFTQTVVSKITQEEAKISSTLIREFLQSGKVNELPYYLGRFFEVEGTVVHGDKRGRKIGFPTANIEIQEPFMIPKTGVYAVLFTDGQMNYQGVCNLGVKPTFTTNVQAPSLEVHIFDFEGDLYEKEVKVTFCEFIRDEKKFDGITELIEQIEKDKKQAIAFFAEHFSVL